MKPIIQIFFLISLILLENPTIAKAEKMKTSSCGFPEAMTFIDKYSGQQDVLEKASECLKNMDANDPLAYLVKGRMIIKSGTMSDGKFSERAVDAAEELYKKAIELAPDNYEVNYYAALFYGTATNGKHETEAQQHLQKILASPSNHERSLYMKMLLLPENNPEKEKLARHFIESPVFVHKHLALAILIKKYWKTDHDLVEKLYGEMFKNGKEHDLNLGWDYDDYARFLIYQKKDLDKAAEMLDISRSYMKFGMQDIREAEIAYRRGYKYVWTDPRDYGKAISLMEKCIQINSDHRFVYYNLAIAYYYHGMNTRNKELVYKARKTMLTAQERNPSYGEFEKYMARINNTISQIEREERE